MPQPGVYPPMKAFPMHTLRLDAQEPESGDTTSPTVDNEPSPGVTGRSFGRRSAHRSQGAGVSRETCRETRGWMVNAPKELGASSERRLGLAQKSAPRSPGRRRMRPDEPTSSRATDPHEWCGVLGGGIRSVRRGDPADQGYRPRRGHRTRSEPRSRIGCLAVTDARPTRDSADPTRGDRCSTRG